MDYQSLGEAAPRYFYSITGAGKVSQVKAAIGFLEMRISKGSLNDQVVARVFSDLNIVVGVFTNYFRAHGGTVEVHDDDVIDRSFYECIFYVARGDEQPGWSAKAELMVYGIEPYSGGEPDPDTIKLVASWFEGMVESFTGAPKGYPQTHAAVQNIGDGISIWFSWQPWKSGPWSQS